MLKALLKKQLLELGATILRKNRNKSKNGKQKSGAGSAVLYILLFAYVFAALGFTFYVMASALCAPLVAEGYTWLYFSLIGTLATAFGVIGSVFTANSLLYRSKDNELLLSMPIPPSCILFSRMFALYLLNFIFEAVVIIPAYLVFFLQYGISVMRLISALALLLILPLFSLGITCILGYLISLISSRMSEKVRNFSAVALSLAFIAGYYYVYSQVQGYLTAIITSSDAVGKTFITRLYPLYRMGLAGSGDLLSLVIFIVMTLAFFGLVYYVLSMSFIRLATAKKGGKKVVYHEKISAQKSVGGALVSRELKHFTGSAAYMLNCGLGAILMPIGAIVLLIKGGEISSVLPTIFGNGEFIALLACAAVAFLSSANDLTAVSVALEGKNLWIVNTLPIDTKKILLSKIAFHLIMSLPGVLLVDLAVIFVMRTGLVASLLILGFTIIYNLFFAAMGLAINLKIPNLNWTNETVAVKQSAGVLISLFGSWVTVIMLAVAYVLLAGFITPILFVLLASLAYGAAALGLYIWIFKRGPVIFASL